MVDPVANGHNPTGADTAAVLEALSPRANHGGWGNDTLTGGDGFGTFTVSTVGGAPSLSFTLGVSNGTFLHGLRRPRDLPGLYAIPMGPATPATTSSARAAMMSSISPPARSVSWRSFVDVDSSSGSILIPVSTAYDNESTVWVGFYDVCNSAGANAGP